MWASNVSRLRVLVDILRSVMSDSQQTRAVGEARPRQWRTPVGRRIYAIGDIHGRADLLPPLHAQIRADAATTVNPLVVYLGDYVDRGPSSFEVLETLIHDPLPGCERIHLKGNHEDMMLRFLKRPIDKTWLVNGGDATLGSYGLSNLPDTGWPPDLESVAIALWDAMPKPHRQFLAALTHSHREGDYIFVHAGVRPGVPLSEQRPADMMWIRDPFLDSDEDFGACVVHGHTIASVPQVESNRIGIDTGAFFTGRLTCLVLENESVRFLCT